MKATELIDFLQECVKYRCDVDVVITKDNGEVYKDFDCFYYFNHSNHDSSLTLEIIE